MKTCKTCHRGINPIYEVYGLCPRCIRRLIDNMAYAVNSYEANNLGDDAYNATTNISMLHFITKMEDAEKYEDPQVKKMREDWERRKQYEREIEEMGK